MASGKAGAVQFNAVVLVVPEPCLDGLANGFADDIAAWLAQTASV